MEALGININLSPSRVSACLEQVGIAFLFAPAMHSAMKYVQPARRELRLRTVFNLLGPLTNPARASAQVVGVYSRDLVEKVAQALNLLGLKRALVVHGSDGLDEITISGLTYVSEVRNGAVSSYQVEPQQFGIDCAPLDSLTGGDAVANAKAIRAILHGENSPKRDVVLLNAAAALVAAGRADSIGEALPIARRSLDEGAAEAKLEALGRFSHQHSASNPV
jgi:anthranilate phosphoribosyltransferase